MQVSTESQLLLTKIVQYQRYRSYYPNITLEPDWDAVQGIVHTLKILHIAPFLRHAKGHQDDTTIYDKLTLEMMSIVAVVHAPLLDMLLLAY
jgi:hypothetical protein